MGDGNFRPPTESTPLYRSPKNLSQVITSATPTAVPIWCTSVHGVLLGEWVKYNWFFYLLVFLPFLFWELTYRSDALTDFRAWCLKRRGLTQGCAFLGFVDTAPHLGGKIPQNPNFGAVNRRFQAKLVKSKNMHIIKTTALIPTKFCIAIKTTKCLSWVVRTHT